MAFDRIIHQIEGASKDLISQWCRDYPRHAWALEQLPEKTQHDILIMIYARRSGKIPESTMEKLWKFANQLEQERDPEQRKKIIKDHHDIFAWEISVYGARH